MKKYLNEIASLISKKLALIKEWVTQVLLKKYLTPFALVLVYFFILGPTSLIAKIFFKSALSKSSQDINTFWLTKKETYSKKTDSLSQS
jgi:hypothetical protein